MNEEPVDRMLDQQDRDAADQPPIWLGFPWRNPSFLGFVAWNGQPRYTTCYWYYSWAR